MPFTPVSEYVGNASPRRLADVRVILTRPKHQCDALVAMLGKLGADARCLPVIEIGGPVDAAPAIAALEEIRRFDFAIFTSANAVRGALLLKRDLPDVSELPQVAAVGPATRRALEKAGITVVISPGHDFSSEGLLRHPRLEASAVGGRQILIAKGAGGRGVLAKALQDAGASVTTVDVYRRSRPEVRISDLLGEPLTDFDLIVLTSGTAIEHLLELASDVERGQILGMPMVVSSERIARIARKRGARRSPLVAAGPEDEDLLRAVESWRQIRSKKPN